MCYCNENWNSIENFLLFEFTQCFRKRKFDWKTTNKCKHHCYQTLENSQSARNGWKDQPTCCFVICFILEQNSSISNNLLYFRHKYYIRTYLTYWISVCLSIKKPQRIWWCCVWKNNQFSNLLSTGPSELRNRREGNHCPTPLDFGRNGNKPLSFKKLL